MTEFGGKGPNEPPTAGNIADCQLTAIVNLEILEHNSPAPLKIAE